jgi:hypothetical protein
MRDRLIPFIATAAFLAPMVARAAEVNFDETFPAAAAPAAAAFGVGMLIFMGVLMLAALAFFVFWVVMLIDCAKRDWPEKNTWLVILIVSLFVQLHWLTAILYYFMIKRKNVGAAAPMMTGPAPQPPPEQPPAPPAPPAAS